MAGEIANYVLGMINDEFLNQGASAKNEDHNKLRLEQQDTNPSTFIELNGTATYSLITGSC